MLKNAKLKTLLFASFSVVLFLMILMLGIALNTLYIINSDLQVIVNDRNIKTSLANDLIDEMNVIARAIRNIILHDNSMDIEYEKERISTARSKFEDAFSKLEKMVRSNQGKEQLAEIRSLQDRLKIITNKVIELSLNQQKANAVILLMKELREPQKQLIDMIGNLIQYQEKLVQESAAKANRDYRVAFWMMLGVGISSILIGIIMAIGILNRVTRTLHQIIEGLNENVEQVVAASGQIQSGSQSLAEGSTQQAASLEETSSASEQISSISKQNAQHAAQADSLMKETVSLIHEANKAMQELICSMNDITRASEETSKIVKSIDEIAFQTNLLALNAAVEAARAGEAGAGFAVVAEEVRNLALRAADAAKNTAALIDTTVKRVNEGSDMVLKNYSSFEKIATSSTNIAQLVGEIASGSREQSLGIEQMNRSIAEIQKVVQQNAANAEENAASSEELNTQANQMESFVQKLVAIVGDNHRGSASQSSKPAILEFAGKRPDFHRPFLKKTTPIDQWDSSNGIGGGTRRLKRSELLIPLDDDEAMI